MNTDLYFAATPEAVDAYLLPKDQSVLNLAKHYNLPLENIGTIGDGVNDLSFLKIIGLGLIGAPSNSQERVKSYVSGSRNGFVSSSEVLDDFFEFYEEAKKARITHIVSDRDGVLVSKSDFSRGNEFFNLAMQMGFQGNPFVMILTGSSYEQNLGFMRGYGLDSRLGVNLAVKENPYLLLVENGAIHVNVISGDLLNFCERLNPELLKKLKGDFEAEVKRQIDREILPDFALGWSSEYSDQVQKIYVPPKRSMVTFNIPRYFKDGRNYRSSEEAEILRRKMIEIMQDTAERMHLGYEIAGSE